MDTDKTGVVSGEREEVTVEMPWVSIVLPTYNRQEELKSSVQSVLGQTYKWFELLIIDDGSTDSTEEIVKEFQDERIKYYRMPENGGQSKARNYGMQQSQYDYIAFQDSDDRWHPDKLELQMKMLLAAPQEIGFVYCNCKYFIEGIGEVVVPDEDIPLERKSGMIYEQLLWNNLVGMPMLIIKKECLDKVGYLDEKLRAQEDYDFALRLSQHYEAVFVDKVLVEASWLLGGVSHDLVSSLLAGCTLLQKHKKAYIETNTLNHRLEIILEEAEKIGMKDQIVSLLEKILSV